jgi:hypothetical protein
MRQALSQTFTIGMVKAVTNVEKSHPLQTPFFYLFYFI